MKIRTKLSITFILLLVFGVTAISSYAILFIRGYLLDQALENLMQDARWMSLSLEGIDESYSNRLRISRLSEVSGYRISVYDSAGVLIMEYPETGIGTDGRTGDARRPGSGIGEESTQGYEYGARPGSEPEAGTRSMYSPTAERGGNLSDSLFAEIFSSPDRLLIVNRRELNFVYAYTTIEPSPVRSEPADTLPVSQNRLTAPDGSTGTYMGSAFSELAAAGVQPSTFILGISTPREAIYEPVKTIRWIIYTGMFISIGLILIVSYLFARYMSKPIMQLTGSSKRIASGDVEHKITLNRSDEFGVLADSINQMASTLRADNAQLKKIYERQQQFIADIAHEIRNPLHTILGSVEMLEIADLPPEKKRHYLRNAKNQAERISSLFKDLILLQRSASDEHFLTPRVFDLSSVTTRIDNIYREELAGRNIDFQVDRHFCKVYGDPERIEQVLDNLISNAGKYTSEGFISLRYYGMEGKVRIQVEDSGIGISGEHLPFLFNRFYRTDKARSRDNGGAGLGLAVVKSIIDAHKTTIRVESTPGKGTRVFFDLGVRPSDRTGNAGHGV
jgi:signal transduction histidine kinase